MPPLSVGQLVSILKSLPQDAPILVRENPRYAVHSIGSDDRLACAVTVVDYGDAWIVSADSEFIPVIDDVPKLPAKDATPVNQDILERLM